MSRFTAIRDPSLRLAILEHLERAGVLDLSAVPPATSEVRTNPRTLHALLNMQVRDRDLAGIAELSWEGGGQSIQHVVWPMWHGEDDTFYVHTLAGIEALTGLKKLLLATDADLAPLLELGALKQARLFLAGGRQATSADTIAALLARKVKLVVENYDRTPRASKPLELPRAPSKAAASPRRPRKP